MQGLPQALQIRVDAGADQDDAGQRALRKVHGGEAQQVELVGHVLHTFVWRGL